MTQANTDRVERLASDLIRAHEGGPKVSGTIERQGPLLAEEAYRVQSRLAERFGPPGAFKVACKPGQPVIMAPIYASTVQKSGTHFSTPAEEPIGIELEIGFKILSPLPAPGSADFRQRLRNCIAAVPVIEIVLTRLAEPDSVSPMLRLADNQLNGGLVVGAERRDWHDMDLTRVSATLDFGGNQILDGEVPVPGGGAFENFCELAKLAGNHCGGLQPGQIAITGSLNGLPYIPAGTSVHGQIDGLGEVSVLFP